MKHSIFFLFIIVLFSCVATSAYISDNHADAIIHHWSYQSPANIALSHISFKCVPSPTYVHSHYHVSLAQLSKEELEAYLRAHSPDEILSQPVLYMSDTFIAVVKSLPDYEMYLKKMYQRFGKIGRFERAIEWVLGNYVPGLRKRIERLYHDFCKERAAKEKHKLAQQQSDQKIIGQSVLDFACSYDISSGDLADNGMTLDQKHIHEQFIEQLSHGARLKALYDHIADFNVFIDAIGYGVSLGIDANKAHDQKAANYWLDFGWQVCDCALAIGQGLAEGAYNTVDGAFQTVRHPCDTMKNIIRGMEAIASLMLPLVRVDCLRDAGFDEKADEAFVQIIEQAQFVIAHCSQQLQETPTREIIKQVTTVASEFAAQAKLFKVACGLCSRLKTVAKKCLKALTAERLAMQVAGDIEPIMVQASEIIQEINTAAPAAQSVATLMQFHAQLMNELRQEIVLLRAILDNTRKGFGEFASKYIKINYEHILGIDLSWTKKGLAQLSGFHHDLMSKVENSGVIKFVNKVYGKLGTYKADIIVNGRLIRDKTFFPADWNREKVINAIYEVYEKFIEDGLTGVLEANGKYKIKGISKEGIEIEMFVTQKGTIVTAYPTLKGSNGIS